jgi:DNA-binding GntR family transcriptional regulator
LQKQYPFYLIVYKDRKTILAMTSVRSLLVSKLRTAFTEGMFKPGERLVERDLCERLVVSRPSLREALRQLEAEGLVDIIPNRGPVVRVIDRAEMLQLWDLRLVMGGLAARRFAEHATPAAIADFEHSIDTHEAALAARDPAAIKSSKSGVFEALAAGAKNRPLFEAFSQINARLSFLWASSLTMPGRPRESIGELRTMLTAIRHANPEVAHAAFVVYSEHSKNSALHGLEQLLGAKAGATPQPPSQPSRILHAE